MDSVRAPALFAELEDDEEIVEDDDIPDDDENEDEQEYEEVMVSRNLLSMVKKDSNQPGLVELISIIV